MATSIYTDEMTGLMHGSPLWEPDCRPHEVSIGDVGYIRQGRFNRLFNAALPPGDPRNEFGTPEGFEQLALDERAMIHRRLSPGALVSRSIVKTGADIEVNGSLLQAGAGFHFSCNRDRGAALVINSEGLRRDSEQRGAFKKYMVKHHKSWLPFANNPPNSRDVSLHDLVFITGRDNTADWAVAAFAQRSTSGGVSFQAGFTPLAGGSFSIWGNWSQLRNIYTNCGPQLEPISNTTGSLVVTTSSNNLFCAATLQQYNQCIFLRGFRFMDRTSQVYGMIKLKVPGSSDGLDLIRQPMFGSRTRSTTTLNTQSPSNSSSKLGSSSAVSTRSLTMSPVSPQSSDGIRLVYTAEPDCFSPAEYLLVYILHNSEAKLAQVHDDDISAVVKACKEYTTFIEALLEVAPQIIVDSDEVGSIAVDGELSNATLSKETVTSGTELDLEQLRVEIESLQAQLAAIRQKISLASTTGPAVARSLSLRTEGGALQGGIMKSKSAEKVIKTPQKSPENAQTKNTAERLPSRTQLFEERSEVQRKLRELQNKRQAALEKQRLKQSEGEEQKRVEQALRAEFRRKEKQIKEQQTRLEARARLLERASAPAFVTERRDYNTLLGYFSPMVAGGGGDSSSMLSPSPPLTTPGSTRRQSIVASPGERENFPGAGWMPLQNKKKTDEDFFVGSGKSSKRNSSKSAQSSSSSKAPSKKKKVNIPLPIIDLLANRGITPPTTFGDIPNTMSEIRRKLEWLDDHEAEATARNLAMTEASLPPLHLLAQ